MNSILKRALRNSLLLAAVVAGIAIFQGETWLTSLLSFAFSTAIFFIALYLSYRFSAKLTSKNDD